MKLCYTKLFSLFIFLVVSVAVSAQMPFQRLSIAEGLSQASVRHMMQDEHGFLWLATDGGLNFYNGYDVKQVDGPDGIFKGQGIAHVLEDSRGVIWVTTDYLGIYTYNPQKHQYSSIVNQEQGSLGATEVFEDNDQIWMVTYSSLMTFDRETGQTKIIVDLAPELSDKAIIRAVQHHEDYIFLGTQKGLYLYQKSLAKLSKLPAIEQSSIKGTFTLSHLVNSNDVKSFALSADKQTLYIGTVSGLFSLAIDDLTQSLLNQQWPLYQGILAQQNVWALETSATDLYIATDNGVFNAALEGNANTQPSFLFDLSETHERLERNPIYSILLDDNNGVWLGTALDGSFQVNLSSLEFTNVMRSAKSAQKLTHNMVYDVVTDDEDKLWVATQNGLNHYDLLSGEIVNYLEAESVDADDLTLNLSMITQVALGDKETLWLNTFAGLVHFSPNTNEILPLVLNNEVANTQLSKLASMYVESEEEIWLLTYDGFYLFNGKTGQLQNLDFLNQVIPPENARTFLGKMSENQLLISAFDHLYAVDTNTYELFPVYPQQPMDVDKNMSVTSWLLADDTLWLGLSQSGLVGLDSETFKVKHHFTGKQGAPEEVYGLHEDAEGDIWFSSHSGIYKFDIQNHFFTQYDEGVIEQEFNEGAHVALADGQLVYGATKGVVIFDPLQVKLRENLDFDVHITDLNLLSRELIVTHDSLNDTTIHLDDGDYGIEVKFATLDYAKQKDTLYHYWITGVENIDYPLSAKNNVMFPKLAPGRYAFYVEAISPLTGQKSAIRKVNIVVAYPPFKSPLAYTLYFLAIVLFVSLWMFKRYHQRRMLLRANRKLSRSEERLELALQASNSGVWDWKSSSNTLYSKRIPEHLGFTGCSETMTVQEHMEFVHPDDIDSARAKFTQFSKSEVATQVISYRMRDSQGNWRWFQDLGQVVERGADGRATRITGTFTDVTESRIDKEKAELFAIALEHTRDWSLITNEDFSEITANNAYYEAFNLPFNTKLEFITEHTGMSVRQLLSYRSLLRDMKLGEHYSGVEEVSTGSGTNYYVLVSISVAISPVDGSKYFVFILSDITAQKEAEKELRQLANFDFLTGLPNRSLLNDRIQHAINIAERRETKLALLFLDLNKFKPINDSLGHNIGDLLLKEVANRLTKNLRGGDTVARLGGDEFVILLENATSREQIAHICEKLVYEVAKPAYLEEHRVSVTPSIGICFYPEDGLKVDELMHKADIAMYEAKALGAGKYEFYQASMYEDSQQKLFIENRLKLGISKKEFINHYQPILDINSKQVVGVELLLRWFCDGEYRLPVGFIELAEEQGLIISMTHDALVTGMWDIKQLRKTYPDMYLSVNLSMQHLKSEKLPQQIESALKYVKLPADALRFEITENVLMEEPETVISVMSKLKEQGVLLALDDFGTGYSSLSYLSQLPLSILKIDKSFIAGIGNSAHDESIIDAILSMAQSLKMATVAEGTETLPQIEYLQERGCNYVQGFYFAKAKRFEELETYLDMNNGADETAI